MKTLFYALLISILFSPQNVSADQPTTTFEITYKDFGTRTYEGCWKCLGYYSEVSNAASIVLYDIDGHSYWTITIARDENQQLDVSFYFTDRHPDLPDKLTGTYYPQEEVNDFFDFAELNLQAGGRIIGKIGPIQTKAFGPNRRAEFVGSFDITLQN